MEQGTADIKVSRRPIVALLLVVPLAIAAEVFAVLLTWRLDLSFGSTIMVDIFVMAIVLVPSLYLLMYRPLRGAIEQGRKTTEHIAASHDMLLTVLDSLDAIVYVADMQTYELVFLNRFAKDIFGDVTGRICWQALQSGQREPCPFCSNKDLVTEDGQIKGMYAWEFQNTVNGHWYDIRDRAVKWIDGRIVRLEIATDITERKEAEQEKERLITRLETAMNEVNVLRGILPICSHCKKIRDDKGYWDQVDVYFAKHSAVDFSHGICPDCLKTHYPQYRGT